MPDLSRLSVLKQQAKFSLEQSHNVVELLATEGATLVKTDLYEGLEAYLKKQIKDPEKQSPFHVCNAFISEMALSSF